MEFLASRDEKTWAEADSRLPSHFSMAFANLEDEGQLTSDQIENVIAVSTCDWSAVVESEDQLAYFMRLVKTKSEGRTTLVKVGNGGAVG